MSDSVLDTIREKLYQPPADQRMPVRKCKAVRLSVAEVRKAVARNPGHRVAKVYERATAGMPTSAYVVLDSSDMQSLLDNTEVRTVEEIVDGARVITKAPVDLVT